MCSNSFPNFGHINHFSDFPGESKHIFLTVPQFYLRVRCRYVGLHMYRFIFAEPIILKDGLTD